MGWEIRFRTMTQGSIFRKQEQTKLAGCEKREALDEEK